KYEDAIYKKWESSGAFTPEISKGKKPFVISMPPPNATGQLHLGHAIMLALQDIMIRYHRMKGDSALWLPGTDHAAIATQNKVEKLLSEKGISRHDLGREKFLSEVKAFVKDSRATIRNQVRKMGSSCDWTREKYTMDPELSVAVNRIFEMMHDDELIYRGDRIVNWCPRCASTLADDEVDYKDENAKLYWIKYGPFELATTRPETKLGDTAVAVNPRDKRYKSMIGKEYMIPGVLEEFKVIVVGDEAVDPEFGSGAVKVTPAHSFVDFDIAKRHGVPVKKIINEEGRMMENCGKYAGMTTAECRKEILDDMEKMGILLKVEDYQHKLSICYRCGTPIEPLTSKQWFIDVNKKIKRLNNKSLKEKSLEVVKDGSIKILPANFTKIYYHWMENLRDWCISRQIWWGHRIPVWYCTECGEIEVSGTHPEKCKKCKSTKFKQDEDTLDTWFSSGLWTFSTLGWPEKTKDFEYFHPTSVMETGYDILFFWVARMILMTTYATGQIPFEKVYLHGLVRDKNGEKMSKSKPETCIDPLEMIDKYGTDALRLSMVIGGSAGNDIRLYEEKIAGYRNFINKIWNSSRFVLMNLNETSEKEFTIADKWIISKLNKLIKEATTQIEKFNFSEAGTLIYDFFWSDFCDWYLEISKGELKNPKALTLVLENILKLLHPFTPFITEVIWENLNKKTLLINEVWPKAEKKNEFSKEEAEMQRVIDAISEIRKARAEYKVDPGKKITAIIYTKFHKEFTELSDPLIRLARLEKLEIKPLKEKAGTTNAKPQNSKSLFLPYTEIYLPLAGMIDLEKEKIRIKKEIEKLEKDVFVLSAKLSNPGFVNNAPKAVVEKETIILQEAEQKLKKLKEEEKALNANP
ncbi:MAG TPA: valine--tRNA ligase, partial [Candidatus Gracilibacteria bacterium]|nr:valine--tRNA ligase [Candidatus Gracilibacteria bacterium]